MKSVKKLFSLFSKQERRRLYGLSVAIAITGVMEAAGIASIMPFMAMVANPRIIHSNRLMNGVYTAFGFSTESVFLIFLGVVVLVMLIVSNGFSAFTAWLSLRFDYMLGHSLAERLLTKYLHQPYIFFLGRNTADLSKNVAIEVNNIIAGILVPALLILTKSVAALCVLGLLVAIDPLLTLVVTLVMGTAYGVMFFLLKRKLTRLGVEANNAGTIRFRAATEALGGVKDLKLLGRESVFIKRFSDSSRILASRLSSSLLIANLPRYAFETLAFGGILLIVLYLLGMRQDLGKTLPLIALYSFAGYRLMPALQQIFSSMATIRYGAPTLDLVYADFVKEFQPELHTPQEKNQSTPVNFSQKIELKNIQFSYPGTKKSVIQGIDLLIKVNTSVGLVGTTGSGKTTLVDIVLGLLTPDKGQLIVDDVNVTSENRRTWQKKLGYVPQSIYLCDDTIARNIAFGIPPEEIEHKAVVRAAQIANLHDFVIALGDGYETMVGDRGVRLSGGQRQRIGIARALYHDPQVLILDEATSALDGVNENVIMDAIHNLSGEKTIIIIAHRLTTVEECHVIHVLEDGKIVESGTYAELIKSSAQFRKMARIE